MIKYIFNLRNCGDMDTEAEKTEFVKKVIALCSLTKTEFATFLEIDSTKLRNKLYTGNKSKFTDAEISKILRLAKKENIYDINGFKLYTDDIKGMCRKIIDFADITVFKAAHEMDLSKDIIYPLYNGETHKIDAAHVKKLLAFAHNYRLKVVIKHNPTIQAD
jgi:hypothetical protein